MVAKKVRIQNKAGIHCRPSSLIMATVEHYPRNTFLLTGSRGSSSMTSILDLLALGLQCGDTAKLQVTGPQEQEAGEKIAEMLEHEYDFH